MIMSGKIHTPLSSLTLACVGFNMCSPFVCDCGTRLTLIEQKL